MTDTTDLEITDPETASDLSIIKSIKGVFDAEWYEANYSKDLTAHRLEGEAAFDFYLRTGARLGHDPNPDFSEIFYRIQNEDVSRAMLDDPRLFGFFHYMKFGVLEPARERGITSPRHGAEIRKILSSLDRLFLAKTYAARARLFPDVVDLYFARVARDQLSPNAEFSEAGYLDFNPDIKDALAADKALISGFHHYLITRAKENRAVISHTGYLTRQRVDASESLDEAAHLVLEANLPGITRLTGLDMLRALEFFDSELDVDVLPPAGQTGLLVLVPHFLPEILFGGYMAFFGFLRRLKAQNNIHLHLAVANLGSEELHAGNLLRMQLDALEVFVLFDDIQRFDASKRRLEIPSNFQVISYASELHYIASRTASRLNIKPIFFIQEYEPDFHANDDLRSFSDRAFLLPHHAIYNSAKLVEFFREKTEVFERAGQDYKFTIIENAIKPLEIERDPYLKLQNSKTTRKLVMYGRPEGHGARNHFAILVHGLRNAARKGVFARGSWKFESLGSLSLHREIDLNGEHCLRVMPKLPKDEYEATLATADIGISVITTPHPGIVHFQMAGFGLITLTNRTEFRTDEWLADQNRNLVPIDMDAESIAEALGRAVTLCENFEQRYSNALGAHLPDADECVLASLSFVEELLGLNETQRN